MACSTSGVRGVLFYSVFPSMLPSKSFIVASLVTPGHINGTSEAGAPGLTGDISDSVTALAGDLDILRLHVPFLPRPEASYKLMP